jgi:hypothetical protein
MRAVATAACMLALVLALVTSGASASPAHAPPPKAAKAAFDRFLDQLYGKVRGYWTCPYESPPAALDECLGEVHVGHLWHQVGADVSSRFGEIAFDHVFAQTWRRHWLPYSHRWIAGGPPGVASVNTTAYGWGFLAGAVAELKDGAHAKFLGYDGDTAGFRRFYLFRCSRNGRLVTCRNALGDAMRYRRG